MEVFMTFILLKLFFSLFGPLMLGLAGAAVNGYIACRDLEVVLKVFKKSSIVTSYAGVWAGGSFFSRSVLSMVVAGSVIWPGKHIRNGSLDAQELACLPGPIKLRMKWSVGLVMGGVGWLFFVFLVLKFST
jgi:hypothetical protein